MILSLVSCCCQSSISTELFTCFTTQSNRHWYVHCLQVYKRKLGRWEQTASYTAKGEGKEKVYNALRFGCLDYIDFGSTMRSAELRRVWLKSWNYPSEKNPFTGQSSTADCTGSNLISLVTSITSLKTTYHMRRGEVLLHRLVVA